MANKATNAEIVQRVHWVMDALLDGLSNYEICRYSSDNWGVTKRSTERYITAANKRIMREVEKDEAEMFARVKRRYKRQYRRAIMNQDWHLVRLLLKDMRELYGFDKPIRVQAEVTKIEKTEIKFIAENIQKIAPEKRLELYKILEDGKNGGDNR